ncbi:hypothetical protein ASE14_01790 [Agromyces sp. Root81]|uniref:PfkB family carbohydrate kinase n=1 Tax=Agromyces sp. Root81 TaxID=1736601 RepID=UPI0007011458|nr:PfkB family carbohydrate kinase [Agromyces sp. Root81]KRC62586.1 hypothetical protein ASE14_01790 [Agromyces sp. Root81]
MTRRLFSVGEALAVFLADAVDRTTGDVGGAEAHADPPGRLAKATRFTRIVSGAEVNVAAGFVAAGHRATIVTRVGHDALGQAVADQLDGLRLDASVGFDTRPTGVLVRTIGGVERGEAVHLRNGAAAEAISPADVDNAWTPYIDVVFVTGITAVRSASAAAAVQRAVELGRQSGALIAVDPNLRPALADRAAFAAALAPLRGCVDIAIGDVDELAVLAGLTPASDVAVDTVVEALRAQGCRVVVVKRGPDGAVAIDDSGTATVGALVAAADVVDTVGAGDAFAAGFLAGMLESATLEQALKRATHAAAEVVLTRGDIPRLSEDSR